MLPLQLAAIGALALRVGFFVATRKFQIRWYIAVLVEVLFLGGIWIWSDQLERLDLTIGTIALSAATSAAITKMRGAWTPIALLFLIAQMIITYGLFMVSDLASSEPGTCIWPGAWHGGLNECDYL